jgi:hypothetical protein
VDAVKAPGTEPEPATSELILGVGAGLEARAGEGEGEAPSVATWDGALQGGNFLDFKPTFDRIGHSRVLWSGLLAEVLTQTRHFPVCYTTPLCQQFMW